MPKSPDTIVAEILNNYSEGHVFTDLPEQFRLEKMLDNLLIDISKIQKDREIIPFEHAELKGYAEREKSLYLLLNKQYSSSEENRKQIKKLSKEIRLIQKNNKNYKTITNQKLVEKNLQIQEKNIAIKDYNNILEKMKNENNSTSITNSEF